MSVPERLSFHISSFFVCALLVAGSLEAQTGTLTGRVIDGSTMRPIAGAQVGFSDLALGSQTRPRGRRFRSVAGRRRR